MGDVLSPFTVSPPPARSSSDNSSLPMLYYGLVVVGIAAIALAIYNLVIINRCNRRHMQSRPAGASAGPNGVVEVVMASGGSFENSQTNLLSSFKYKKEGVKEEEQEGGSGDYECPVCLSGFEEGEDVRKLPRCKHSFHALCIDMWLYSHFDCPVCRTPVGPFCHRFQPENSGHGGVSV